MLHIHTSFQHHVSAFKTLYTHATATSKTVTSSVLLLTEYRMNNVSQGDLGKQKTQSAQQCTETIMLFCLRSKRYQATLAVFPWVAISHQVKEDISNVTQNNKKCERGVGFQALLLNLLQLRWKVTHPLCPVLVIAGLEEWRCEYLGCCQTWVPWLKPATQPTAICMLSTRTDTINSRVLDTGCCRLHKLY